MIASDLPFAKGRLINAIDAEILGLAVDAERPIDPILSPRTAGCGYGGWKRIAATRGSRIIDVLGIAVVDVQGQAMRSAVGDRKLKSVVVGVGHIAPWIGSAAILRHPGKHMGNCRIGVN